MEENIMDVFLNVAVEEVAKLQVRENAIFLKLSKDTAVCHITIVPNFQAWIHWGEPAYTPGGQVSI